MVKIKSISRAKDRAEWSHRGRSANINYSIFSTQVQWSQFRQKKGRKSWYVTGDEAEGGKDCQKLKLNFH